jgi:hypothetical protein
MSPIHKASLKFLAGAAGVALGSVANLARSEVSTSSVITSKPAINDHFKTGQRSRTQDMKLFYLSDGSSGKLFLIFFLIHRAPSRPAGGRRNAFVFPS